MVGRVLCTSCPLFAALILLIGCGLTDNDPRATSTPEVGDLSGQWTTLDAPPRPTSWEPRDGLLFQSATGESLRYFSVLLDVSNLSWATYSSSLDGFSIDYPADWVVMTTDYQGHEGLAVYPPGTDSTANIPGGAKGIGFGWSNNYQEPTSSSLTDNGPVVIDGVAGNVYTVGELGHVIAAVFPYRDGWFGISADVESDLLIAVFQRMLESLNFS